jgi:hypothetical protein
MIELKQLKQGQTSNFTYSSSGIEGQVERLIEQVESESILGQKKTRKTALMRRLFTHLLLAPGSTIKILSSAMGEKDILVLTLVEDLVGQNILERRDDGGLYIISAEPVDFIPVSYKEVSVDRRIYLAKMILAWEKYWRGRCRWHVSGPSQIDIYFGGKIRCRSSIESGDLVLTFWWLKDLNKLGISSNNELPYKIKCESSEKLTKIMARLA